MRFYIRNSERTNKRKSKKKIGEIEDLRKVSEIDATKMYCSRNCVKGMGGKLKLKRGILLGKRGTDIQMLWTNTKGEKHTAELEKDYFWKKKLGGQGGKLCFQKALVSNGSWWGGGRERTKKLPGEKTAYPD